MTISRVASFSQSQSLVAGLLRNQEEMFVSQQQINTGKKAQSYQGYAQETSTLVSARSVKSRTDTFVRTAQSVGSEMETSDVHLSAIIEAARSVRQTVLTVVSTADATGLRQNLQQDFQLAASSLNAQVGGRFLFSGSRADERPFNPTDLDQLVTMRTAGTDFSNDNVKASAQVADTVTMQYGMLADEIAEPLMQVLADIRAYDTGGGNLVGKMDPAQLAFLTGKLADLDAAIETIQGEQVQNGLNQKKIDEIALQMSDRSTYLETFISDIEDVDISAAISRLQADQTALEASYRMIGSVSQLSLSRFL
jgi:flagellar hook-associated protein 3 FlgL